MIFSPTSRKDSDQPLSEHLDALRGVVLRSMVVWLVAAVAAFCCKDGIFQLILSPAHHFFGQDGTIHPPAFIATELTAQFVMHIRVSLFVGLIVALPYIIVELYHFIAPALHTQSRKLTVSLIASSVGLFWMGVAVNYLIIFPFAFQFLNQYSVSDSVQNLFTLSSYISMLLTLSLVMGLLFELPVLSYLLARMGLLTAVQMRHYRRHAIVGILILAAAITPTGDAFTLALVSVPIYLLYEISILIVARQNK